MDKLTHEAASHPVTVSLVCITTGMNLSRARTDFEHLADGSLSERSSESARGWEMLPYQTGLLQVYAQTHAADPARYKFRLPLHRRRSVEKSVPELLGADIAGFSTYVWNMRHSLKIARLLKEREPGVLIMFGGPQVPDRAEGFLRENPFVDVAVHGEGERIFLRLLEAFPSNDWSEIPSVSFLDKAGRFIHHPKGARIEDLAVIPPVYASGVFDPLLEANPNTEWMAPIETNRGCPFSCTFCDWGSATATKVFKFSLENIYKEFDWIGQHKVETVFCCDANYGMLPRDVEITDYIADVRTRTNYPRVFVTQNTKNSTERSYRVQKRLNDVGLNSGVTLSFQSLDPTALRSVKRDNISIDSFAQLQSRYKLEEIPTYTDIILGLPGETYDSFVDGFSTIIAGGQHRHLFFYNCQLLPNAEISLPEQVKEHGLVTVDQEIVEVHSDIDKCRNEETPEYVKTVIATNALPADQWVEAKTVMWMAELVYFQRLLQLPFVVLHELYGLDYGRLIEAFAKADGELFPVVRGVVDFFHQRAREIQSGSWEYCPSEKWLNMVWPAHEHALIGLVQDSKLGAFYQEAKGILLQYAQEKVPAGLDPLLLIEAVDFNQKLFRIPFPGSSLRVRVQHNLWEFYQGVLAGKPVPLENKPVAYAVWRTRPGFKRFDDWLEYLIYSHNSRQDYLYPCTLLPPEPKPEDVASQPAHAVAEQHT
ncbi:MAG TPA: radical SAM protein [Terriglobia bacterium]|jgi:tRNA A37 methylthiotransferase MiaB